MLLECLARYNLECMVCLRWYGCGWDSGWGVMEAGLALGTFGCSLFNLQATLHWCLSVLRPFNLWLMIKSLS